MELFRARQPALAAKYVRTAASNVEARIPVGTVGRLLD